MAEKSIRYGIFGAGHNGLTILRQLGEENVDFFCDNNKHGVYYEKPVLSFVDAKKEFNRVQLILSVDSEYIRGQLNALNIDYIDYANRENYCDFLGDYYLRILLSENFYKGEKKRDKTWFREYYCDNDNKKLVEAIKKNDYEHLLQKVYDNTLVYNDEYFDRRPGMIVVANAILQRKCKKICDIACGYGDFLRHMNSMGAECYGIEFDSRRVNLLKDSGITCCQGRAESIGYVDDSFDVVTCMECLEHVRDPFEVVREAYRILKNNGYFYVTVPNGTGCDCSEHVRQFDKDDLYSIAQKCGMSEIRIIELPYLYDRVKDNMLMECKKIG